MGQARMQSNIMLKMWVHVEHSIAVNPDIVVVSMMGIKVRCRTIFLGSRFLAFRLSFFFHHGIVFVMNLLTSILTLAAVVSAHYDFPALIAGSTKTAQWQYVRQWSGSHTYNPVVDVTSKDIRCNVKGDSIFAPGTFSVAAGSTVGFTADPPIYHPGPLQAYMAKVPAGKTAANWDGAGSVWFKIFGQGPNLGGQALTWPSDSMSFLLSHNTMLKNLM